MSPPVVHTFGPVRPWVPPGAPFTVVATISMTEAAPARVSVDLLDLDRSVGTAERAVTLAPGSDHLEFALRLPETPRRGYGLRLAVETPDGIVTEIAAIEALEGWWQSPRHAAVTEYGDPEAAGRAAAELAGWQVNVVQHYDWMWRHYRYRPPDGASVFKDALGRTVSHDALRASVAAGHAAGIAALAYGAVYGAEPEHVERHPDDRVFDEHGEPLSLGGAFFINDIRPGSAWRRRLLREYADAIRNFDFDGIHMDTYGPPYAAETADREHIEFAQLYPGLIEEAADLLARTATDTRVLFNCVDGFPLESIAAAPAAALYLELWPPDNSFADVVRWIDRARAVAAGRHVVIAAYAAALKDLETTADRAAAFEAVPLLGSVIAAAGAYHHTLAEDGRLLVEGYYPAAVAMTPAEAGELRALWRFGARYVHLLSAPERTAFGPEGLVIRDAADRDVPWSTEAEAGSIWVRATARPDGPRVLHLVDLRDQPDTDWTSPKRVASPVEGMRLQWAGVDPLVAMSPWTEHGDATPLPDGVTDRELPPFQRWLVVTER